MRSALAAAAALAVLGCKRQQPPAPPATLVEWAQPSPDGRLEIRERREGTSCRVQAVVKSPDGDRSLWSTQTCLPTSRVVFLSPNGDRVLVLDLIPASQQAQASDWSRTPLMSVWVRGAVVRQYTGAEILGEERASDMTKVLSWVRGDAYDDAKRAAHLSGDGEQVIVNLVDGRALTVGFDGAALPPPPEPAKPAALPTRKVAGLPDQPPPLEPVPASARGEPSAFDESALYSWVDDQGSLNFGHGSQIPVQYRKHARPVDATVGVIPMDVQATQPAAGAPGAAPAPGGAAAPAAGAPAPASGDGQQPVRPQPKPPPATGL
jgi:hypothetical protein